MRKQVCNWGNFPKTNCEYEDFKTLEDLKKKVLRSDNVIARGLGRSYGDASLGEHIISTESFNKILSFDSETGILHCEAGVSIEQILEYAVPLAWFPYVTPGTKYVTIGGSIAADVHGKNHHKEGTFSDYVLEMKVMGKDGELQSCSPDHNTDLFRATVGGMGLTGIITSASIQLKKIETAYIKQEIVPCNNLEAMISAFEDSFSYTYSVAWIDCFAIGNSLGKGILYRGEHASFEDVGQQTQSPLKIAVKNKLNVPFNFPSFALNKLSIRLFNYLYSWMQKRKSSPQILPYDGFFYPLDNINNWNRIYGKKGFVQYQMVLPKNVGAEGLRKILEKISQNNYGSFLAVLKLFGGKSHGLMSFPEEGYTLALDFPVNKKVFELLDNLDEIVKDYGGKLYLAKDARMSKESFLQMYPELKQFNSHRAQWKVEEKFASSQSRRLEANDTKKQKKDQMAIDSKEVLILGANSDVAKALAELFARDGYKLCLASRNTSQLNLEKEKLQKKYSVEVDVKPFDALQYQTHREFYDSLERKPNVAVLSFGVLGDQFEEQKDFSLVEKTINTNFTGAVSITEIIAADMEKNGKGSIIGISSVAGDRGRKKNYFYGAAKAAFSEYLSGLRQRLLVSGVHVLTVKPGFIYSKMTEGLDMPAKLTATPEQVASDIYSAFQKKKNVIYTKSLWRLIMFIIKNIPEAIFKKLNF